MSPLTELPLRAYTPRSQLRAAPTYVERAAVPAIDAHNHLGRWLTPDGAWMAPDVGRLVATMDECNVAAMVNLDGRMFELADNLARYDRRYPGRFLTFCQLDWSSLASGSGSRQLVADLTRAADAGARGVKVWKSLGLEYADAAGNLVLPDDERIEDVWATAGALGLPVLIHTADPVAFFDPLDASNERLEELSVHPDWWFGDRSRFPTFERLMDALESVVSRFPATTFIGAHVGCYAENLSWVDRMLTTYPNFNVDVGGRMAELGRQPRATRTLIERHPDRVVFGTDAYPVSARAFRNWFRFIETEDESFEYEPSYAIPPQGRWAVHALGVPDQLLEALYAGNARRLLGITDF
ncbi:MAG: amidohydrolase family protein [Mycobacteriales bacterium]